jgi:hypothetical protein
LHTGRAWPNAAAPPRPRLGVVGHGAAERLVEADRLHIEQLGSRGIGDDRGRGESFDQGLATPASTGVTKPIHSEDAEIPQRRTVRGQRERGLVATAQML